MERDMQNLGMELQRTVVVIIPKGTFCSMAIMFNPIQPLAQTLKSVLITILVFDG